MTLGVVPIFVAGFVGALAPEIVRLYQLRQEPQTFHAWYYGVSLVYALLAGYVATILPGVAEGPLWWAFAVGAGLNAVVSLAARQATTLIPGTAPGAGETYGPLPAPPTPSPAPTVDVSRGVQEVSRGEAPAPGPAKEPELPRSGTMADFWRAL